MSQMKGFLWGFAVVILANACIGFAYGTLLVIQTYEPNTSTEYSTLSIIIEATKHASQVKLSIALSTLPFLLGGYVGAMKSRENGLRSAAVLATLFCAPTVYSMYSGISKFTTHEDLLFIFLMLASSLSGAYLFTRKSSPIESSQGI
jgi:hypothetical protein